MRISTAYGRTSGIFAALIMLAIFSLDVFAAVPYRINYQGRLKQNGLPVNGLTQIDITIWDAPTGGTEWWANGGANMISVSSGLFNTVLTAGTIHDMSQVNWASITPYIQVSVAGVTLTPREQINSSMYSMFSASAAYALSAQSSSGITGGTAGAVPFQTNVSATGFDVGNNFFWDSTNHRLGIGTTSPAANVDLFSNSPATPEQLRLSYDNVTPGTYRYASFFVDNNGWLTITTTGSANMYLQPGGSSVIVPGGKQLVQYGGTSFLGDSIVNNNVNTNLTITSRGGTSGDLVLGVGGGAAGTVKVNTASNQNFAVGSNQLYVQGTDGNVGIGNANPGVLMQVGNTVSTGVQYEALASAAGYEDGLQFWSGGASKWKI